MNSKQTATATRTTCDADGCDARLKTQNPYCRTHRPRCGDAQCERVLRLDNRSGYCKDHRMQDADAYARSRAAQRAYRQTPEAMEAERQRQRRLRNSDYGVVIKATKKAYYDRNAERLKADRREWAKTEHGRKTRQAWLEANREKMRENDRRYYAENMDRFRAYRQKSYYANPEKHRRYARERYIRKGGHGYQRNKPALLDIQSNTCPWCLDGDRDDDMWTVDHIVPIVHGGTSDIDNLQAMHYSCNSSKRDRYDEEVFTRTRFTMEATS